MMCFICARAFSESVRLPLSLISKHLIASVFLHVNYLQFFWQFLSENQWNKNLFNFAQPLLTHFHSFLLPSLHIFVPLIRSNHFTSTYDYAAFCSPAIRLPSHSNWLPFNGGIVPILSPSFLHFAPFRPWFSTLFACWFFLQPSHSYT